MKKQILPSISSKWVPFLWIAAFVLLMALLFARVVYPEILWATIAAAVAFIATLGTLIAHHRQALTTRTAAYGFHSLVTVLLVLGIVGVVNFLGSRYPQKLDLTKNKVHTLSDQTSKLVKGLKKPVRAVYFAKINQQPARPLLENLKGLNPNFEVEYVDPDKEPARAKQVGIKKYGTLQLIASGRENKLEEVTEEKLTNALIKLLKEKALTLCSITGHGEKSFNSQEAEGYEAAKKALNEQSYEIREVNLAQEGKIPDGCDALAVLGPNKSFFEGELKQIREYLENGGRAAIALDMNLKGAEFAPEFTQLLQAWHIRAGNALIVDPISRLLGVDAAVPVIATFSKDHAITRDFQNQCFFPFARPLEIIPGAPAGMNVQWLGQTTPKSFAESDLKELATGKVSQDPAKDRAGPHNAAIAVEGKLKDSKAPRNTRLVVFATSHFATNNYSRFGGNFDFFLNSISWLMEDESLIAIRTKEEGPGKVELSQKAGSVIFLLTVIVIPLLTIVAGIAIWYRRRRL